MSKVCRCCLIEGSSMKNLFSFRIESGNDDEAEDLTLAAAYIQCTNLQLSQDTEQSYEICFNCEEKLIAAYEFKILCRTASKMLNLRRSKVMNDLKNNEDFWDAEFLYNVPSLSKGNFFGEPQTTLESQRRSTSESSDDNSTEFENLEEPEIIRKEESKITEHKSVFKCTGCEKAFSKHRFYRIHSEKVHNSDWECEFCDERFDSHSIQTYLTHRQIHTFDPVFNCNVCNSFFRHKKTLGNHRCSGAQPEESKTIETDVESSSKLTDKAFLCPICGFKSNRRDSLMDHQRTHTGEKPYGCDICGKHFSQRTTLRYHKQLHTGKKTKCELCPKAFASNAFLKQHMRSHNNERLFKCETCDKSYTMRHSLQQHIRVHHRLIRYECSHCEKVFTCKSEVKTHETIHTGKLWWCPKCDYKSTTKNTLKLHIANVHKLSIDDLNVKIRELGTTHSNDGEGLRIENC